MNPDLPLFSSTEESSRCVPLHNHNANYLTLDSLAGLPRQTLAIVVFLTAPSGPWARPPAGPSQVMVLGGGIRSYGAGLRLQAPEVRKSAILRSCRGPNWSSNRCGWWKILLDARGLFSRLVGGICAGFTDRQTKTSLIAESLAPGTFVLGHVYMYCNL